MLGPAKTFRFYREFVGFEIQTIFVSEYLDNSGQRQYEALWVFSDKAVGEARFRGPEERIDLIPLENNIVRIVEKTAFEFDVNGNGGLKTNAHTDSAKHSWVL